MRRILQKGWGPQLFCFRLRHSRNNNDNAKGSAPSYQDSDRRNSSNDSLHNVFQKKKKNTSAQVMVVEHTQESHDKIDEEEDAKVSFSASLSTSSKPASPRRSSLCSSHRTNVDNSIRRQRCHRQVQFNLGGTEELESRMSPMARSSTTKFDPWSLWYSPMELDRLRAQLMANIRTFYAHDMQRGALGIQALKSLNQECHVAYDSDCPFAESDRISKTKKAASLRRSITMDYIYGIDEKDENTTILGLERVILGVQHVEAIRSERRHLVVCQDKHIWHQVQRNAQNQQSKQQKEGWPSTNSFEENDDPWKLEELEPQATTTATQGTMTDGGPYQHPVSCASRAASQFAHELARRLAASL